MQGRSLVERALARKNTDANPFWLGNPADETKALYLSALGISAPCLSGSIGAPGASLDSVLHTKLSSKLDIDLALGTASDMIWFSPELDPLAWKHPEGKPMWDVTGGAQVESLSQPGIFAETESVSEIDAFDWPNPERLCFDTTYDNVKAAYDKDLAVFGGMWCPFFHVVSDFFGMENYFVKMYTDPDVVLAVTEHVVEFYLETNKRCLDKMSGYLSAGFFGNDLGSQLNALISPECFQKFVLPYIKKIAAQIKSYGLPVAMHSCGAVSDIIPFLIDAGVEVLHPIQAAAAGMDPGQLQRRYGKDLVFIGGVDTQELLPFGTVEQVADKVKELTSIFGPNFIVSPSHEALLPNVAFDKVIAMSKVAKE